MKQILAIILVLFTIDAQSQDFATEFNDKLDTQIEKYVEGISPGMAVGIVKNSEIVFQKYIGYSNLENQTEINENTRFNIASNAKQFTALCILKLIELQLGKILRPDRVGDLIVTDSVQTRDDRAHRRDNQHGLQVFKLDSWNQ